MDEKRLVNALKKLKDEIDKINTTLENINNKNDNKFY